MNNVIELGVAALDRHADEADIRDTADYVIEGILDENDEAKVAKLVHEVAGKTVQDIFVALKADPKVQKALDDELERVAHVIYESFKD